MKKNYIFIACIFGFLTIHATGTANAGCLEKEKAIASLETAETLLTEAGASFPSCAKDRNSTNESECTRKKPLAYIEVSKKLISDVWRNFPSCSKPIEKDDVIVKYENPRDCSEILTNGLNASGVYTIWVGETLTPGKPLLVYCDMDTGDGGWTVIQRRGKYPVQEDFYVGWVNYKIGFGNILEEFWLGNENIRVLCHKGCEIRFDLEDEKEEKGFAHYNNFNLSSVYYRIRISGYTGNVGDGMKHHDNLGFSTKDYGETRQVNSYFRGGWWHMRSHLYVNLNGVYRPGGSYLDTVYWYSWREKNNLASVEIKVRPN